MSLKTFTLPGKDSRCVCYDGQVFKIKMLMPPPENGEYLDGPSLQKEVEDIIRAVLAVPQTVDPTVMRTKHLVAKPEKKEWKLPNKVDFKENGRLLEARPFMYVLNLKLIEEINNSAVSEQNTLVTGSHGGKATGTRRNITPSSPVSSPSKRQRRQLYPEDTKIEQHSPKPPPRKNARMAPSRSTSRSRTRYTLGKRALNLSSSQKGRKAAYHRLTPDIRELQEGNSLDEEVEVIQDDERSEMMNREKMDVEREGQGSPVLESGFSRLVQQSATLKHVGSDESGEPMQSHADLPCTGDKGPSPVKPSGGGAAARVSLLVHPGRDTVEQHVLAEQIRLQQMAGPVGDNQAVDPGQEAKGVVRHVIDYKVFRIIPETEEELRFITDVAAEGWKTSPYQLDIWKHPTRVGREVDVMVSPDKQLEFLNSLSYPGLTIETWIPNVQPLIDEGETKRVRRAAMNPNSTFDYNTYHKYEEIAAWMDDFSASNVGVTKVAVTSTIEGETVYGLQIEKNTAATNVAYIQGGIHAREWVSPATMINLARMFIEDYGVDNTVTDMLNNFKWIIVPVFNVDGYKFSHTTDRMWRKNRNPNDGAKGRCIGVDLNRNYPYEWGRAGRSKCLEDYQGTGPLSEPETSGSNAFLETFGSNLKLFIDFHSYGQYWLHPWGYTRKTAPHPDREAQRDAATDIKNSIFATYGMSYFVGESGPGMYPATGGSEDFGYGTLGVKYTYVVELRDENTYGFELPPEQIQPTAEEIYAGMKTLGARLNSEYGSALTSTSNATGGDGKNSDCH